MKFLDNPIVPFLLFIFYYFHQLVMPEDTPLQTVAVVFFLIYGIVCSFRLHKKPNDFLRFVDAFILIQVVYFIFRYPYFQMSPPRVYGFAINQIKSVLVVMVPIYTYLYYGLNGKLKLRHIIIFSISFLLLSIPQFFYLAYYIRDNFGWIEEFDETTNNTAYYFLQCCIFLPLIAHKKYLSMIILLIIVFFLVLGVKRGAILIFVCVLPFYLRFLFKNNSKFFIPIVLLVAGVAAVYMIDYFSQMDYLFVRIQETQEGNSSGRNVIYAKMLKNVFEDDATILGILFGHGFNASVDIMKLAHNDWLELLTGFGFNGIIIYLGIMICVYQIMRKTSNDAIKLCLKMGLIIWVMETLFSMAYASNPFQFIVIAGLCGISIRDNILSKTKILR